MRFRGAMTDPSDFDTQVTRVAALADPVRRSLYRFVASTEGPVSRDQAATGVGIQRSLAAHHLDRLADEGLLEVEFRRLSGRQGPGAGRPAKLYRRGRRQVAVTMPPRRYDLAGRLLAESIIESEHTGAAVADAVREVARRHGRALAEEVRDRAGRGGGREALRRALVAVLADHGFEPRLTDDEVDLANCPFHELAIEFTDLICGLNLSLHEGIIEGLDRRLGLHAEIEPRPERCCVALRATR
jgi:predicted ArsR family transcriptional regulator